MGLMDKVKAQASTLGQKAQETASAAQAKLDASQANRRADGMLRHLGLAYLAERTGRAGPDSAATIDKLISDLVQHESQNNVDLVQQAGAGGGQFMSSSPGTADPSVAAYPQQAPTGFPEATPPTSFPQAGGPTGFPEATPPTSFPQAGGPTGFPEATPPTSFPQAPPAGFGEPMAEPPPEPTEQATGFPPPAQG